MEIGSIAYRDGYRFCYKDIGFVIAFEDGEPIDLRIFENLSDSLKI
jgi:hypothetical protein